MDDLVVKDPSNCLSSLLVKIKCAFYKLVTAICFIIFPTKLSSLFANLTILSLIYSIRGLKIEEKVVNNKNLNALFETYIMRTYLYFLELLYGFSGRIKH